MTAQERDETADVSPEEELQKVLERERSKAESYLDRWTRTEADFQNYKKRVEQERAELARYAAAPVVASLLPVMDDLERALDAVPWAMRNLTWVDGLQLIYRKFLATLEAHGVREIPAQDENFDPRMHEAVLHGEGPEGKIVQVFQKGYYLNDRVLRPAMVQVGSGGEPKVGEKSEPASSHGDDSAGEGGGSR